MPVDRADVAHAEGLEERRRLQELAHRGLERLDGLLGRRADDRHVAQQLLEPALAADVGRVEADVGEQLRQAVADAADRAGCSLRVGRRCGVAKAVRLETVGA